MTNVKIQIVSFSYPTNKILKTCNGFVIVSKKKMGHRLAFLRQTVSAFGRPIFSYVLVCYSLTSAVERISGFAQASKVLENEVLS